MSERERDTNKEMEVTERERDGWCSLDVFSDEFSPNFLGSIQSSG